MKKLLLSFFLCFLFLHPQVLCAQDDTKDEIQAVFNQINQYADSTALERIYIHTDKPFYAVKDTIWFKAYLFQMANLNASKKSGLMYVEVANDQNQVVKRLIVPLNIGLGAGNIALTEKDFPQGNYTLRAYTNWMLNYNDKYVTTIPFYIISSGEMDLLINAKASLRSEGLKQKIDIGLGLMKTDKNPSALTDFLLQVKEGNKVLYKSDIRTSINGTADFNFEIAEKADLSKLSIGLQDSKKIDNQRTYNIPVILNRPENIDLQFMPESGSLVAGLHNRVAFKALAEDGSGPSVSGKIYDSSQKEILSFQSAHLGIGSFSFIPVAGESYTARIKIPGNKDSKIYSLPAVKLSGLTMSIINKLESDSLEINIDGSSDLKAGNVLYYLMGQSRGVSFYAASIRLPAGIKKIMVNKGLFPTGVARFTILNRGKQVLNERITFIDHKDYLNVEINSNKKEYIKRDSVGLDLFVKDKDGKPVAGSFSIAVTDDGQVKTDGLKRNSLKSDLFLTSVLKGDIEDPGYYFPHVLTWEIWQHLDNLLLAQGWVNYDWPSVFQPLKPTLFKAEDSFTISGNVTNAFNKPVKGSGVLLFSKKPVFVSDAITDDEGRFSFKNIYPSDTTVYFLQAKNKNGKSFNVGIQVDEFKPPVFTASNSRILPWYLNNDSAKTATLNNYITYQENKEKLKGPNVLKEVNIIGVRRIKDSKNLNKDGGSDFSMDEEALYKEGNMTLSELLFKNVKGFRIGPIRRPFRYFVSYEIVHFVIDGIYLDYFRPSEREDLSYKDYIDSYLNYYTAKDIKGIEVMFNGTKTSPYFQKFLDPRSITTKHCFIEITTYGGVGPFLKRRAGNLVLKPESFSPEVQFYSPKYRTKTDAVLPDTRSTIFWSPDVVTDENGKATVSFYTADQAGSYTLFIEGSDMNGHVESTSKKIIVKQ